MGYIFDIPEDLQQPGKLPDLIEYLQHIPISGKIKKHILLEYRDLTGQEITTEDINAVYPEH